MLVKVSADGPVVEVRGKIGGQSAGEYVSLGMAIPFRVSGLGRTAQTAKLPTTNTNIADDEQDTADGATRPGHTKAPDL